MSGAEVDSPVIVDGRVRSWRPIGDGGCRECGAHRRLFTVGGGERSCGRCVAKRVVAEIKKARGEA